MRGDGKTRIPPPGSGPSVHCLPCLLVFLGSAHVGSDCGVFIHMKFPARGSPRPLRPGQVSFCIRAVVGSHTAVVHLVHACTMW